MIKPLPLHLLHRMADETWEHGSLDDYLLVIEHIKKSEKEEEHGDGDASPLQAEYRVPFNAS